VRRETAEHNVVIHAEAAELCVDVRDIHRVSELLLDWSYELCACCLARRPQSANVAEPMVCPPSWGSGKVNFVLCSFGECAAEGSVGMHHTLGDEEGGIDIAAYGDSSNKGYYLALAMLRDAGVFLATSGEDLCYM